MTDRIIDAYLYARKSAPGCEHRVFVSAIRPIGCERPPLRKFSVKKKCVHR